MNSPERVFCALERKAPDRVPLFETVIDEKVMQAIYPGCTYAEFVDRFGLDVAGMNRSSWPKANLVFVDKEKGLFRDHWGVIRAIGPESSPYPVEGPIKRPEDVTSYLPPDPNAPGALGELPNTVKQFQGKKAIIWIGRDSFFNAAHLRGVEQFLMDIHLNPGLVHQLIEITQSFDLPLIERAVKAGVEVVVLGDDYADKNAPFMSPKHFREFFLPGLKKAVDVAHRAGAYVIKHSDGNLMPILDMIVESGIDGLNPLEPVAGMSIAKVRELYGNRICLVGNVDCGPLLCWGTAEEVRKTVRQCLIDGARDGAFMLSSSNSITTGVKPENFVAMGEALAEWGTYPLRVE
jgi:uroporphyrinogen decarboxylase